MYSSFAAFHSRIEDEDLEDGPAGALSCFVAVVVVVVGERYQWCVV